MKKTDMVREKEKEYTMQDHTHHTEAVFIVKSSLHCRDCKLVNYVKKQSSDYKTDRHTSTWRECNNKNSDHLCHQSYTNSNSI